MSWDEDGPCNQTDLPPISRFSSSALSCLPWPPRTHAATAQPSSQPSPADSCLKRVLSRKRLLVVSTMIMVRIYQSTPPEFQAILVGGLCPGAEDVAQCEANLPEFWGMIAALLWPGYWDPSVGLAAPFIPFSHSNLAKKIGNCVWCHNLAECASCAKKFWTNIMSVCKLRFPY